MDPITVGLITGGASLLGNIFSSTSAANTSSANAMIAAQTATQNQREQIAAQKEMLGESERFNSAEAGMARDMQNAQFWEAERFNSAEMQKAQSFNAAQAEVQRQYQTQMSNTAYQRASADMKAAGLNPMMMFGSGGPSSTPVGGMASSPSASVSPGGSASASVGTPSVPMKTFAPPTKGNPFAGLSELGDAAGKAVTSAVQAKTLEKMTDEIANLQTQRGLLDAQTQSEKERPELVRSQSDLSKADYRKRISEGTITEYGVPAARFSAKMSQDLLDMPDWLRRAATVGSFTGGKISDAIAPVVSAAGTISKFMGR